MVEVLMEVSIEVVERVEEIVEHGQEHKFGIENQEGQEGGGLPDVAKAKHQVGNHQVENIANRLTQQKEAKCPN